MQNLDSKKLIIGFIVLVVVIVGGSYLYTRIAKKPAGQVDQVSQTTSKQTTSSPSSNIIAQDVNNPALQGLASATSENTLTINVFVDTNGNGKKDEGENNFNQDVEVAYGLPGKTSNAHTGTLGQVIFKNVDAGTFTVYLFNPPPDYTTTTPTTVSDVKIPPSATLDFGLKPTK